MASRYQATPDLLRRHEAAMRIVKSVDETDRILLLAYVVAPTPEILEAQRESQARQAEEPQERLLVV